MTGKANSCFGCAHRAVRMRGSTPRSWCKKYHTATTQRCIDYKSKPNAIEQALAFIKRTSLKRTT